MHDLAWQNSMALVTKGWGSITEESPAMNSWRVMQAKLQSCPLFGQVYVCILNCASALAAKVRVAVVEGEHSLSPCAIGFCMGSRASVIIRIILCCLVDITALLVSLCIRQCLIDPVFGMWRGFKISCMEKHPENVARQEVDFDFRHLGYFMIFRNGTTLAQQRHFEIHDCSTHLRHNCSSHLLNFTKKQWQRQKITKRHTTLFHKRSTALLLSLVCGLWLCYSLWMSHWQGCDVFGLVWLVLLKEGLPSSRRKFFSMGSSATLFKHL